MSKPKIGFIGLGYMGSAMVECLQGAGYDLIVLGNRDRTGVEAALARGASEVANAREVAEGADIVMFCMGSSDHVESRVYGDDGVLAGVSEGQIVIDFGTSLPGSTLKIGADLAKKGAHYLDAPLGRTPAHAAKGLLNIMCAGEKTIYEKVKPEFDTLGENVFHLGELGSGNTIKLINNFYSMTVACAMAEAFVMADRAGVAREQLYNVMAAGPLKSGMMDFIKNYACEGQIDLAFSVTNGSKDVNYYNIMAGDLGVKSAMSVAADRALKSAIADGQGDLTIPEMVDYFDKSFAK